MWNRQTEKKELMMYRIDLKDRKILYELGLNCRQTNTQIGKKVGLKKDVVSYRIKKMQEEGIIKNFWTAINTFKLGYKVFRIYITFQFVSIDKKNEIIQHFVNYKNAWAVISVRGGGVDLVVILWVNNSYEFYRFWNKTLDLFENYFAKATISLYIQAIDYKKTYLLPNELDKSDREHYRITCDEKTVKIDKIDHQLLNELAINARAPLIELAEKLDCSSQTINYRIKNLIKNDIIKAFRVHLDYSKLGLQHFKVDIYLKEHKKLQPIINHLKDKPYMQCLNMTIGWADLEPEFIVKSIEELNQIIDDLNSKFPMVIGKYTYWVTEKIHKERWLPEF
ncbi:MAG: hypothetical protein DRN08_05420 [Thermoplasmata archaeon]|nr:MAG: hypothetical protein DRN08_05420 [Thermoplasmata archaeon]